MNAYVKLNDPVVLGRFRAKYVESPTGCWIWQGGCGRNGYAVFYPTSLATQAHRWAYMAMVGPIPADRPQLDHLCRVRNCVNPAHLEPVDNRENQRRGEHPTSGVAFRTNTCPQGHSLSDAYLIKTKAGKTQRRCRPCQKASYAAYVARKRGAA